MALSARSVAGGVWRALVAATVFAVVVYLGVCLWFATHQRDFVYSAGGSATTPAAAGAPWLAAVDIRTDDGERIDGWWLPPPAGHGVVVFLHGSPGTLAGTVDILGELARRGFGLLAIDYRGYGGSTGSPSERGLTADARAAYDFARKAAPAAPIAAFGESLGTGVAVALAGQRKLAGLLLNSPFASLPRHWQMHALPLPYRWLMTERFDSEAAIAAVPAPVLILAGTGDAQTPVGEARRLYAAAHEPKTLIEVPGVGHLMAWYDGAAKEKAMQALAAWTMPAPLAAQD